MLTFKTRTALASRASSLSSITNAVVLHQYTERRNQYALRALLPDRATTPSLTKRPLANGSLHPDDVPDAGACRRAVTAKSIQSACHAFACRNLIISEI